MIKSMNRKILIYPFLVFLLMPTSCVYKPQVVDIPLIEKKNDLRIDAGISCIPSAQATVSYGLTDKIAVQAFGCVGSGKRYYLQGAIGTYKNLGNKNIMEVYGGFGRGYGSAESQANGGNLYGNYQLYYVQFDYGRVNCRFAHMDYGFGIKSGYFHTSLTDYNYYDVTSGPFEIYKDKSLLVEPTFFVRLGGEKVRFCLKLGTSLIFKCTHKDNSLPYIPANVGLALNFRL